jgi:hypothetical protein
MRTRTNQPVLQAQSENYATRTVLTHKPENKRRDYASRELQRKADQTLVELNKLFGV